jgi:hypothetical protein
MNVTRALLAAALGVAALAGCAAAPAAPLAAVPITSVAGWAPVTDAGTGVRADLPGPARQESEPVIAPDREVRGVAYHALEPTGRVEAVLHISPLPGDERVAPQQAAERTAYLLSGELSRSAPLVAEGHPAVRRLGPHRGLGPRHAPPADHRHPGVRGHRRGQRRPRGRCARPRGVRPRLPDPANPLRTAAA